VVLVVFGGFIADRINKLPMVLTLLLTYLVLFTVASFFVDTALLAEIFRAPDVHALLFFAFFMLDDPPTSPVRYEDQVVYAMVVATVSYLAFMAWGVVYFLPAGLLAGNVWESARRVVVDKRRRRPAR
jgi:Na+-translocating ferredoxin:NAD+ oxidoreductase RnfD subunit